jgi:hypothetical protein
MAGKPEEGLYHLDASEARTIRISKEKLVGKFGLYSASNPKGVQYDDESREIQLAGKDRAIPAHMLEVEHKGKWIPLSEHPEAKGGSSSPSLFKASGSKSATYLKKLGLNEARQLVANYLAAKPVVRPPTKPTCPPGGT